jgi:hypothetical protein
MSEDTSDGFADQPRLMVKCRGCGFNVETDEVRQEDPDSMDRMCLRCVKCHDKPDMRESYRRGFNAGLDAMADAVMHTAKHSALRKTREED